MLQLSKRQDTMNNDYFFVVVGKPASFSVHGHGDSVISIIFEYPVLNRTMKVMATCKHLTNLMSWFKRETERMEKLSVARIMYMVLGILLAL